MDFSPVTSSEELISGTAVAGMTYIPTVETTVVTTTKTTTTALPQVILKPQVPFSDLDPKVYPLASSSTPASLQSFIFDVNGTPTLFKESTDSAASWRKFTTQKHALSGSDGVIQSVVHHPTFQAFDASRTAPRGVSMYNSGAPRHTQLRRNTSASEDTPSDENFLQRRKRRRTDYQQLDPTTTPGVRVSQIEAQSIQPPINLPHTPKRVRRTSGENPPRVSILEPRADHLMIPSLLTPTAQSDGEDSILGQEDTADPTALSYQPLRASHGFSTDSEDVPHVATPPIDHRDVIRYEDSQEQPIDHAVRTMTLMNVLVQGASLPSPTLSPTLGMQPDELIGRRRSHTSERVEPTHRTTRSPAPSASQYASDLLPTRRAHNHIRGMSPSFSHSTPPTTVVSSLPDLASMVSSYENMAQDMQTYLLYQLLRRSTKSTIKTVAQICDPALRVDFIRLLPQELRINIIQYLDVKSLCRAAQVSKHWRHIIDTAEHLWKRAMLGDGLTVSESELWRAIREGWGWQSPHGPEGAEEDLNQIRLNESGHGDSTFRDPEQTHQIVTRAMRGNRRIISRTATATRSRKQTKKVTGVRPDLVPGYQTVRDSPQAARTLAENLVSPPRDGLASLQELHLYKSLYRRQFQLRQSWFDPRVKPLHLAFRAHSTKVVTCLQFDSDKIVSGSDDHLINVYDTQTGALRNSLVGHEGGVWAFQYIGKVLVSGSTDRTVRLWDLDRGLCTHILEGHTSTVRCLQVVDPVQVGTDANGVPIMQPPERLIISGSRDSSLRIWKFPVDGDAPIPPGGVIRGQTAITAYYRRVLSGHHHSVRALHAYGDRVVSGSYDTNVCVWRISTGERLHRLSGHINKVYSVVLDHERDRCISGAMDNSIKIWSLETGQVLHNLEGHSSLVGLLSLEHGCLVSAAADSTLRVWDPETGQCRRTLAAHTGAITCFQHDTRKVVSGSDKTLKVWDINTGREIHNILTGLTGVWQCKFNDRRCVAAVSRKGNTYIEVVDFGAVRDGVPLERRGRRIVVNRSGQEVPDIVDPVELVEPNVFTFQAMVQQIVEDPDD